MTETTGASTVHTVLGPVPADQLGVVTVHEALLAVLPGADLAPDISMDRAVILEALVAKVAAFKAAGGGTIVDATGMFGGRNVPLLESLSRATGVHVVASTGLGPEENLGGYFRTPQTNPPTPWPADRFADLFTREVTEGMVVPRIERRAAAGLVTTTATRPGRTGSDESLLVGAARAAAASGAPLSFRFGDDPVAELDQALAEGVAADRVLVADLDRADAAGAARQVAGRGAYVGLDNVGTEGGGYLSDAERADLVSDLVAEGFGDRVLLSCSALGVAKGLPAREVPFEHVLTAFVPLLTARGVSDADVQRLLVANPAAWLTITTAQTQEA